MSTKEPWPNGTRVYVTKVYRDPENRGPACRTGVIIEHKPQNGGYLVRHDETEDMGIFGRCRLFGWCYHKLQMVQ